MKCKLRKGKDGFSFEKIYDIHYLGNYVYWIKNDYNEIIYDSDESFQIID